MLLQTVSIKALNMIPKHLSLTNLLQVHSYLSSVPSRAFMQMTINPHFISQSTYLCYLQKQNKTDQVGFLFRQGRSRRENSGFKDQPKKSSRTQGDAESKQLHNVQQIQAELKNAANRLAGRKKKKTYSRLQLKKQPL